MTADPAIRAALTEPQRGSKAMVDTPKPRADFAALADRIEQAFAKAFQPTADKCFLDMADSYCNITTWTDPPGLSRVASGPRDRWPGDKPEKGEKPGPSTHSVVWAHDALPGCDFRSAREVVDALRAAAREGGE